MWGNCFVYITSTRGSRFITGIAWKYWAPPVVGGVIVSDPPYGIGFVHGAESGPHATKFAGVKVIGDDKPFDPSHLLKFKSVLLWGANHYADRLPVREGRWLVWDKRCGVIPVQPASDCEIAWCRGSSGTAARMFRHYWAGFNRQSERGIPRVHPTQKPEALMAWCLGFLPEGRVIDPYMGSGTTLVAAKRARRECVGIEVSEEYCEIAAKRLSQGVLDFQVEADLARCDREQAEILALPEVVDGQAPAWLVTLGLEDWEAEKRLIREQAAFEFPKD